jgi:hypothetical protein
MADDPESGGAAAARSAGGRERSVWAGMRQVRERAARGIRFRFLGLSSTVSTCPTNLT